MRVGEPWHHRRLNQCCGCSQAPRDRGDSWQDSHRYCGDSRRCGGVDPSEACGAGDLGHGLEVEASVDDSRRSKSGSRLDGCSSGCEVPP